MAGRFQNQKGMSLLRHAAAVANSRIRRTGKDAYPSLIICGCSADCGFARVVERNHCSINKPVLGYIRRDGIEIKCDIHGTHRVYECYRE